MQRIGSYLSTLGGARGGTMHEYFAAAQYYGMNVIPAKAKIQCPFVRHLYGHCCDRTQFSCKDLAAGEYFSQKQANAA